MMNPLILAFLGSFGTPEMILIFVIVLLLFGAKKLPQLARGVGKSAGEFKKAKDEFENQIKSAADEAEQDVIESDPKEKASPQSTNPKIADPSEKNTESAP